MVLLRRVIGDALRARRKRQHRTLREVSTAANVSLGYLSEIERGQKEPSSELLAAVCDALGAQLSDVLRQVSDSLAMAEEMEQVLAPVTGPADAAEPVPTERVPADRVPAERVPVRAIRLPRPAEPVRRVTRDGEVAVSVRHDTPLRTTLRARPTGPGHADEREREVVYA